MSTAPQRGFPDTEFAARCAAAQAAMARRGIDAMLFASEAEIRYFTGFLTPFWQSPTRPWFLVLPLGQVSGYGPVKGAVVLCSG